MGGVRVSVVIAGDPNRDTGHGTSAEAVANFPVMSEPSKADGVRDRFAELHLSGTFVMPNAWDVGSARVLESIGFDAIATTSSGFAATMGRHDQSVQLNELAVHVADLCAAVRVPVSVDAEAGYAEDTAGLAATVELLAGAGAAGISIEDYLPGRGILDRGEATERVAAVVQAATPHGVLVTARAENYLYGVDDLDDTISRLRSYGEAGADVLYAPWITDPAGIARLVESVGRPANVLLRPDAPPVAELARLGARRISTGGALALLAYGAAASVARQLLEGQPADLFAGALTREQRDRAFGA